MAMSDYQRIAQAISFITQEVDQQPTLDEIAAHCQMSPFHFQCLFSRWAGVSPKRYIQVLTVQLAKQLLLHKPLLEVSNELGLSSSSRLHDHFINLEAVTPGEYKQGGRGLTIEYAIQETPFGQTFIAITERGICRLAFVDNGDLDEHLVYLSQHWPRAQQVHNSDSTAEVVEKLFVEKPGLDRPLSLYVSGTNFQVNVWKALLQIPTAKLSSYGEVAKAVAKPKASRAVGSAIGANPVAFLIPCHRVIQQNGRLGGYHWGLTRKRAMYAWEAARQE